MVARQRRRHRAGGKGCARRPRWRRRSECGVADGGVEGAVAMAMLKAEAATEEAKTVKLMAMVKLVAEACADLTREEGKAADSTVCSELSS